MPPGRTGHPCGFIFRPAARRSRPPGRIPRFSFSGEPSCRYAAKVSFVPDMFRMKASFISFSISMMAFRPVQWVGMT